MHRYIEDSSKYLSKKGRSVTILVDTNPTSSKPRQTKQTTRRSVCELARKETTSPEKSINQTHIHIRHIHSTKRPDPVNINHHAEPSIAPTHRIRPIRLPPLRTRLRLRSIRTPRQRRQDDVITDHHHVEEHVRQEGIRSAVRHGGRIDNVPQVARDVVDPRAEGPSLEL